ncbi:MAG: hypothetical protein B6229_08080 [Spirochaetaceae bacterium 4572_7]|nr:MAG: hypothetical protein B6229_08080 [Spirochaetaceae bacterium 4572_7]
MSENKHLYMVLHPNNFLISSGLTPEELGQHYLTGSSQNYNGRLIFAELDINFRNDYFDIDWALDQIVPHADGRPKATKFISAYRVLEHVDFSAIKRLYLANSTGAVLPLESSEYTHKVNPSSFKIFAGITPTKILAMSTQSFVEYGAELTKKGNRKGAPKCFYTQIQFHATEFQENFKNQPLIPSPIPGVHPAIVDRTIEEIKNNPNKIAKGLKLHSSFHEFPLRLIRHGFMFSSETEYKYFPMPSDSEIEDKFYHFYKSM